MDEVDARQVGVDDLVHFVLGPTLNRCGNCAWIWVSGRLAATSTTKVALRKRLRSRIGDEKALRASSISSSRIARRSLSLDRKVLDVAQQRGEHRLEVVVVVGRVRAGARRRR